MNGACPNVSPSENASTKFYIHNMRIGDIPYKLVGGVITDVILNTTLYFR